MKTFQDFCEDAYQLNEFRIGNPLNNPLLKQVTQNPLVKRGVNLGIRAFGFDTATNRSLDPATRLSGAISVVKPHSPTVLAPSIFAQGQSGSLTDKVARKIPGMTPNPQTDIGKRMGDVIMNFAKGK
jgi:hypothetical protein